MKKEDLLAQGLTEEQAKYVMENHGKTVTTLNKTITTLQASETTLKNDIAERDKDLKELQENKGNSDELNTQLADMTSKYEKSQKELAEIADKNTLSEALRGAGATDVDYMIYRLGALEKDENGAFKDLGNKIKDLKESNPTHFGADSNKDDEDTQPPAGFKTIENDLKDGKQSEPNLVSEFTAAFTDDIPAPTK